MAVLAGKVGIITGASSGIGRAYATALAGQGVSLVLAGRSTTRLQEVAGSLPGEHLVFAGDLADVAECGRLVTAALERFGHLDLVLANAGVYLPGEFATADLSAVEQLIGINITGTFALVREALPHLLAQGSGDILITSSISGHQAIHWEPVYSASKHAVQAFTHTLRRQLVGTGVRVGEIAPGVVLTELWGVTDAAQRIEPVAKATGIEPEQVAEVAVFMLTRDRHVNIRDVVILPTSQEI